MTGGNIVTTTRYMLFYAFKGPKIVVINRGARRFFFAGGGGCNLWLIAPTFLLQCMHIKENNWCSPNPSVENNLASSLFNCNNIVNVILRMSFYFFFSNFVTDSVLAAYLSILL